MGMDRARYGRWRCHPPSRFRSQRLSLYSIEFHRKRLAKLREVSQVSLEIQSDKILKGTDQDQTTLVSGIDIQGKLSSDVVTSTSKPQTPSSSLVGMKKTLGSQVSLLRCSACKQIIQSDKSLKGSSDQDQTTLVSEIDIQEKLSSGIVSSTSKPRKGKRFRFSSKMPKVFQKKKKKKKKKKSSRREAVSKLPQLSIYS